MINKASLKLEFSGAHTPHASCINKSPALTVLCLELEARKLTIFTDMLFWTCAHEQRTHGQQSIGMAIKTPYCDTHGPCQSIQSIVKQVFRQLQLIRRTYKSLRCLDVVIWWFSWWQQTKPIAFPLVHAHGVIRPHRNTHAAEVPVYWSAEYTGA